MDAPHTPSLSKQRSCFGGFLHGLTLLVMGSKLNLLLMAVPFAIIFEILDVTSATFIFSMIALVPLAERLGYVTEELATYTNDTLGGLLNATFGNATELIICAVSLYNAGDDHDTSFLRIVQLSLLGSVMGNLLLVMGTAFLVGGIVHSRQEFNQEGMGVNSGMLFMAVAAIVLPSALSETGTEENKGDSELHLSRFESILMLILYASFLVFQLVTHKHLYEQMPGDTEAPSASMDQSDSAPKDDKLAEGQMVTARMIHRQKTLIRIESDRNHDEAMEKSTEEDSEIGLKWCIFWLAIITVFIAFLSEMVVDTIKEAHDSLGVPLPFLSTILLPLVGNAAEHASAILFAYKNKMEITLGVAVGSATQIAVFAIPFTVVLAWIMGQPLDLDFEWFEAFTLFLCALITFIAVNGGSSNWIKGLILVMTYVFVSAAFWVHSDSDLSGD